MVLKPCHNLNNKETIDNCDKTTNYPTKGTVTVNLFNNFLNTTSWPM